MSVLGDLYREENRFPEAISILEEGLDHRRARSGPDDPHTLLAINALALAYEDAGRRAEAVPLYETALSSSKSRLGPSHPFTLLIMYDLAWAYDKMGRSADALLLLAETLKGSVTVYGPYHPTTFFRLVYTIVATERSERWAEAAILHAKHVELLRRKLPPDHPDLAQNLYNFGNCQLKAGNPAAAEGPLCECLHIFDQKLPDDWRRFSTIALVGQSLLGQKKYSDAEPFLLKGYEGMKTREKGIPHEKSSALPEAADRLIELYTAMNRPDDAGKWRSERAKYPEIARCHGRSSERWIRSWQGWR